MKGMAKIPLLIATGIVGLILLMSGLYVVDETQQVIITQFGEPVGEAVTTPGLKFKIPLIQAANFFDKRFLEWDGDANQVPTRDKRFIWVDSYARWRISNPQNLLVMGHSLSLLSQVGVPRKRTSSSLSTPVDV